MSFYDHWQRKNEEKKIGKTKQQNRCINSFGIAPSRCCVAAWWFDHNNVSKPWQYEVFVLSPQRCNVLTPSSPCSTEHRMQFVCTIEWVSLSMRDETLTSDDDDDDVVAFLIECTKIETAFILCTFICDASQLYRVQLICCVQSSLTVERMMEINFYSVMFIFICRPNALHIRYHLMLQMLFGVLVRARWNAPNCHSIRVLGTHTATAVVSHMRTHARHMQLIRLFYI